MRVLFIGLTAIILSACASGVKVTPVNIEPVQQIKADPFDPDEVFETAQSQFEEENYTDALYSFSQIMAYDRQRLDARLGAGETLLALGRFEKAARIFWHEGSGWEQSEFAIPASIGKTLSGIYTDRIENVETAINDAMVLSSEDARLWNAKGQWHDRRGEWIDALTCYVTAMDQGKWRSGTINNIGMSLLLQGRYREAKAKFTQAHDMSQQTEVYDNNLRMAHILTNDLSAALADISERRAADILNDAGYVAQKRGQDSLAKLLFEKALDISPVFHPNAQANLNRLLSDDETAP